MPVDNGIRNTTMLVVLMCIPLIVASCQHTFGRGDLPTNAPGIEEQALEEAVAFATNQEAVALATNVDPQPQEGVDPSHEAAADARDADADDAQDADFAQNVDTSDDASSEPEVLVSSSSADSATSETAFETTDLSSTPATVEPASGITGPPADGGEITAEPLSTDTDIMAQGISAEPPVAEVATRSQDEAADVESADKIASPAAGEASPKAVLDATAEFEKWSVELDDNIRAAVLREILNQLEKASGNLDSRQAQLERLYVEAELYRMQIQHLQNRRQEWESAAE